MSGIAPANSSGLIFNVATLFEAANFVAGSLKLVNNTLLDIIWKTELHIFIGFRIMIMKNHWFLLDQSIFLTEVL